MLKSQGVPVFRPVPAVADKEYFHSIFHLRNESLRLCAAWAVDKSSGICYPYLKFHGTEGAYDHRRKDPAAAESALLSMAACWGIYAVFRRCRGPWRAGGFALLLMIPYPICLVRLAARFFPAVRPDPASDLFHGGITLALALACFGLDSLRSRRKDER